MSEQQLKVWDIVNEQIKFNHNKRINWKSILGQTLTKAIAGYYAQGKTPQENLEILTSKINSNNPMLLKNLKIGVCARYGEIKSESKTISEVYRNGTK